ncbi:P-loop containing nucleoside triphosphate hydrolase protein [Phellopilus nigrolimitatus]|nr:P-loop containing nucleoside triphosphate hydrolase protein [Phellopilus nigrolimitatus]
MRECRFFSTRGGCLKGSQCTFAHGSPIERDERARPDPGGTLGSSPPSPRQTRERNITANAIDTPAPNGVCRIFWKHGNCKREFGCRFRHESPSNAEPAHADSSHLSNRNWRTGRGLEGDDNPRTQELEIIAPFLTDAGLAKMSGSGSDVFASGGATGKKLNPQEMQGQLRIFLFDDYRFRSTTQMCGFASLLSNASAMNNSWTDEDGQLLLKSIATGNGILRLGDIIRHSDVSINAGSDRNVLSFQKGYLPIIQYFSSNFVVKSTMNHLVNALYSLLDLNLGHVLQIIDRCMSDFMAAKSFKDARRPLTKSLSGSEVMMPLADVLFEYLTRFKNATATHEKLKLFADHFKEWVDSWIDGTSASPPTFEDPLSTTPEHRVFVARKLKERLQRTINIVDREQTALDRSSNRQLHVKSANSRSLTAKANLDSVLAALSNSYEGPGEERLEGRRHDNDFVDINEIQVAPTDDELTCRVAPFLPANIPNAPHPYPSDSIQRVLDIQFRLLREELTAPLRKACQFVEEDMLSADPSKTRLSAIKRKQGGRYQHQDRNDSVMFSVYTGVEFAGLRCDRRRGIVVDLRFDTPPGSARLESPNARAAYWKGRSGKRLMQGGLIALVWPRGHRLGVFLGSIASSNTELVESAKHNSASIVVRVQFYEPSINVRILEELRARTAPQDALLIESPVMFEAIRPFLESLKREPESLPFAKYIVHQSSGSLSDVKIDPPSYSLIPNFAFDLECLRREDDDADMLPLKVTDPGSIAAVRDELKDRSGLDPSQADAIVDALTREVALIQGPPGTGKTFVGVELIRVLVKNKARPIVMIAFTNHALDHMLRSVLDAGITTNIVRLGARCSDERVAPFSIEELEKMSGRSRLERFVQDDIQELKHVENEMKELLEEFTGAKVNHDSLESHIGIQYSDHEAVLSNPPRWILALYRLQTSEVDNGKWRKVGQKGETEEIDVSLYGFWRRGGDIEFLQQPRRRTGSQTTGLPTTANHFDVLASLTPDHKEPDLISDEEDTDDNPEDEDIENVWHNRIPNPLPSPHVKTDTDEDEDIDLPKPGHFSQKPKVTPSDDDASVGHASFSLSDLSDVEGFFSTLGQPTIPHAPVSNRNLHELLGYYEVWYMSLAERERLHCYWAAEVNELLCETNKDRFKSLADRHARLRERQREGDEEIRIQIMRNADVIGCTTTGAARLTSMLKGLSPKVMLVEEAGQVLESHVLASLVESVEHLVLIGDPLQLRPTLNNYGLSMDNPRGRKLYRFDMSLMERLSSSGLNMSRLDVQRRMRPSISDLVRVTLYPGLLDHELVNQYPPVRGMGKDVFFLSHSHKEQGGGEDSVSKHNLFEVSMIKDLVRYLLRQGCYSAEGSIVVLCAYLGQLARVRDALASEFVVVIDERDQVALADKDESTDEQDDVTIERVRLSQRVKVRSVDNYQGEEADIIILSLVRNSGDGRGSDDDPHIETRSSRNIGFLKSENRTNVALSRARHGLYILGNSLDLSTQSSMWFEVIEKLQEQDSIGKRLPIRCHRHPDEIRYVSRPDELPAMSPDGGCLESCDFRLPCGHNCPYKCHCDDEGHRNVRCDQDCQRLCPRGHPCSRICAEDCGQCMYPVRNITLPCGHVEEAVPCWRLEDLEQIFCKVKTNRRFPSCEHSAIMECGIDIRMEECRAVCDGIMSNCCSKSCKSKCSECQGLSPEMDGPNEFRPRTTHKSHPCSKPLHCQHTCSRVCTPEHNCSDPCISKCRQSCSHSRCTLPCSKPCSPCQEPCTWICPHHSCPVPCGSICARLPCDQPCSNILRCGHRCPSVCGENCNSQVCLTCSPSHVLDSIGDFILQRTLGDLIPELGSLDECIITLPDCQHAFTVETLDGHCGMTDYYEQDTKGNWTGLLLPPTGYKKPPTCPTCRTAIRSPRYGRIYKRADLDILEINIASDFARSLGVVKVAISGFDRKTSEENMKEKVNRLVPGKADVSAETTKKRVKRRKGLLNVDNNDLPISWEALDPGSSVYHGIPEKQLSVWRDMTRVLQKSYKEALRVAETRSAHTKAWESAFVSFHRQEIESSMQDLARAPRRLDEHAMRMARMKIGNSKPLADKRFRVEAIWLTLEIRFVLAGLASVWLNPQPTRPNYQSTHGRIWAEYIAFVLKSCEHDAIVAMDIAKASDSRRQMVRSKFFSLNSKLESFKFSYHMSREQMISKEEREKLADRAIERMKEVKKAVTFETTSYRRAGATVAAMEEFSSMFVQPANILLEEWKNLEHALRKGDDFYAPVSDEERQQIVAAFRTGYDFGHSGHFYTCPNGHPFVITECGGATQTARCPECFEAIGGSNHNLIATNRRDTVMEDIAREQGALPSPFPWGR